MAADTRDPGRPKFKAVQPIVAPPSPEALFYRLGRRRTHGYLRGPQQDVLREYAEKYVTAADVAFELPTGTGKTAVGLLVAEWARQSGKRAAYLTLTNQLAGQVLAEAGRLDIECADVRGTRDTRDVSEVGRFKTCAAVGVTTYSNLFNINPVIRECDLLIFDDAHGGEHFAADMWTVSVHRATDRGLYEGLLAALRPGLSDAQIRAVTDSSGVPVVEIVDVYGHDECVTATTATLDVATADSVKYAWRAIRNRVKSCLFLVSSSEITIQPRIPPTHTHAPFADVRQRVYMSATLGGESDLRRAYGVEVIKMVRAKSPQWGRRYVFVPGVYVSEAAANALSAALWDRTQPRRAVLLAPSERVMDVSYDALAKDMAVAPTRYGAVDIAESIDAFVTGENAMLTLAGRYDGLDLPDDQCRLLLMSGSPGATTPLERHLTQRWKLGPAFRRHERTRLTQGMGRCTRSATDFAVIVWLGQSLVDAATSKALLSGMPAELAAEIRWGIKQSESAKDGGGDLLNMIHGLLGDPGYRKAADEDIASIEVGGSPSDPEQYEQFGIDEVRFGRAMWDEDYTRAVQIARNIADQVTAPELSGYRAWWWYLTSVAARLMGDVATEQDALRRGSKCGVNAGWLNRILRERGETPSGDADTVCEPHAEGIWDLLDDWGWAGPRFEDNVAEMLRQLSLPDHASYHKGLEALGKCLGAQTTRLTEAGAPDVVWSFPTDVHFVFEVKTEKRPDGTISKRDLQEAKGHPEWVRARLCGGRASAAIEPVMVSATTTVHEVGLPFTGGLYHVRPARIQEWAGRVVDGLRGIRTKYMGREFAAVAADLSATIRANGMGMESIASTVAGTPLKN